MKMLLRSVSDDELARVRAAAPSIEFVIARDRDEALALAPQVEAAYGWCDAEFLSRAPQLRWIQVVSAGVERYLFPEIAESDVVLTNAREIYAPQLADHTIAFILCFARELPELLRRQREGKWEGRQGIESVELQGQTLLIVGLGGTGSELARRAAAFGMRILATRRHVDRGHPPFVERLEPPERLRNLLPEADYVALCCPLTRETRHLIGAGELALMKPTAVLANVTRGGVVDSEAVVAALRSGRIAGAGLDVTEPEPLPPDSPLWHLPNVIITPHSSGQSQSANARLIDLLCENARRFAAGGPMICVVDKKLGY